MPSSVHFVPCNSFLYHWILDHQSFFTKASASGKKKKSLRNLSSVLRHSLKVVLCCPLKKPVPGGLSSDHMVLPFS